MTAGWPDLELLLRGDLIAVSRLSRTTTRDAMLEALRQRAPSLAQTSDSGPDVAIVDALASCLEVMGFYHDRFLTESKLGSAQLLDNLARIVALIGYRPLPAVAATAYQYFEAIAAGFVDQGTRVAGKPVTAPTTIAFETAAGIAISPELNRMALSPVITRSAGARRAVVTQLLPSSAPAVPAVLDAIATAQQARGPALPTDDFRTRTDAMIADNLGLELVPVAASRSRAVAFDRALTRSFDASSAVVSRTTVIRHLRTPRTLAPDLVAFEVSDAPILHLPSAAAPEILTSTLEVFVLRPDDDKVDPSEWAPALAYREVADFSGSEVADLHYRTFVDDALHTWIILRKNLGARVVLDDAALDRVYVRFAPAVGSVLAPGPVAPGAGPSPAPDLSGATLGLDPSYFLTSLVAPPIAGARLTTAATWAMVDRDLGLSSGDSILIQDGAQTWVRTLVAPSPGSASSPRLLRWAADPPDYTPPAEHDLPGAHDPVGLALDPTSAKIGALTDAATGDELPTWSDFYAQLEPLSAPEKVPEQAPDLPIVAASSAGVITRQRVVAAGTTHLLLGDASHISPGDYLLIGQRLTAAYRAPGPFGPWRTRQGEPAFDPRTPWLDAEIVQAIEVRGNVVRLASPVSKAYYRHDGRIATPDTGKPTRLSEVVAVPGVVSVASGDQLRQTIDATTQPTFTDKKGKRYDASYQIGALDRAYSAEELRRPLQPTSSPPPPPVLAVLLKTPTPKPQPLPPSPQDLWSRLFVAVAGIAEAQPGAVWHLGATVQGRHLRARPADIARLEDARGTRLDAGDLTSALARGTPVALASTAAAGLIVGASDGGVVSVLAKPPAWQLTHGVPAAGEFRVDAPVGFDLVPEPHELGRDYLLDQHGTLVLLPEPAPGKAPTELQAKFHWDADGKAPRVDAAIAAVGASFEALFIADSASVGVPAQLGAATDWRIPAARFSDAAFRAIDLGTFVAVTDDSVVFECPFAQTATDPAQTGSEPSFDLTGVPLTSIPGPASASIQDPLHGITAAWAVVPGDLRITPSDVHARWVFAFPDAHDLPAPRTAIQLALIGARRQLIDARIGDDGRSAVVRSDDDRSGAVQLSRDALTGDLGFELDALCVLDDQAIPAAEIAASTAWIWRGIDPQLPDLPEPRDSQLVAVVASPDGGVVTAVWRRDQVWWTPERRTLVLPAAQVAAIPGARPSDVVRLIQILAPPIERHRLTIRYDLTTDRSIVTLAMAAGWPGRELAPAPVVIATTTGYEIEVRETAAPVDVLVDADGGVRWSLHFAGDVRDRWRDLHVALRDWRAPAELGLAQAPLWRVPDSPDRRARVATGTVTLIAAATPPAPAVDDFVRVAALARVADDGIELVPLDDDDAFPATGAIARIQLPIRTVRRAAGAAMALTGTTLLDLGASLGPQLPPITHVVFADGARWRPIQVKTRTSDRQYELDGAYLSVFPDGIASDQPVRLCRATTALGSAALATAFTLRLRLPGAGASLPHAPAGNAAVLHNGDLATRLVLDAAAPPALDKDALVVVLALPAAGLAAVFDDHVAPQWSQLALAERWPVPVAKSLQSQPLRVTLGGPLPYKIGPRDVFVLGFAQGASVTAEVESCNSQGALALDTTEPVEPTTLTLYGLRTRIDPTDYTAGLDLTPTVSQPPWLMSFTASAGPDSLRATFLPYATTEPIPGGTAQRFTFTGTTVVEIFRHADGPLYLFSNERGELRDDLYTETDDHVAKSLAATPTLNFLSPSSTTVDRLVLTSSAWAGQGLTEHPRRVVLCSTEWTPSAYDPGLPPELFPEVKVVSATRGRVATGFALQSVRFNSGNFIPAAGQVTTPAAALIASALRVSALAVALDGTPLPGASWQPVRFAPLEQLIQELKPAQRIPPFTLPDLEGLTYQDAVDQSILGKDTAYVFSASFSATGACTLHFLFADRRLVETVRVRIEAQYEVTPGRTGAGLADPIYPFETAVEPFDPATQLALLAPSQLRPGALVFVRTPPGHDVPELQWTQVSRVTGSIVDVDPPLAYVPGPSLEPTAVTGLGKLIGAAKLDADYYATLAKAKLAPGGALPALLEERVLLLGDRLPLDVASPSATSPPLAALMPGDHVLVFDERSRQAWAAARQTSEPDGAPGATGWQQWPDDQHEAIVKRVDRDTGVVVLAAPLPDRFRIRWSLDPRNQRLTPEMNDVTALRVLPHYRAPVQGPRMLTVLGSGDSTRRFARYTSTLDAGTGSAVIPLGLAGVAGNLDGITTGNLEVLSFDPEKATWTRWLRYDRLSRAKKVPAFELGFRPATAGRIPVSVTFGDGATGQLLPTGSSNIYLRTTRIGAAATWLAQRRPVRIRQAPPVTTTRALKVMPGVATPTTQRFWLEHSAPAELIGAANLAARQWQPTLEITVTATDHTVRTYREISLDDATHGAHGFVLAATPGIAPGLVEVQLYTPEPLGDATVTAWQVPGSRQWALDDRFYQALQPDLTDKPGATSLQLLSTEGLRAGSLVAVFPDAGGAPDIAPLAAVDPPTWSATLGEPLPRAYDLDRSFLRGNVVGIVQGAVETITIGSSDGVTASLRLPLQNKQPLLHVLVDDEPTPDIHVLVAGQTWTRVFDFTQATPASRYWRLDLDVDGSAFVEFGDGTRGAIPPAGTDNITARVRAGEGAAGNLPVGAIGKLVSDNLAVKSTTNLTASAGGSAGDPPGVARDKAFAHRLPSDRVVTASDCVRVAIGESDVIAAAVDPTADPGVIRLVVAMADRRTPTDADLDAVYERVAGAMPVTAGVPRKRVASTPAPSPVPAMQFLPRSGPESIGSARARLEVVPAEQHPVHIVVELGVLDGHPAIEVFAAVRAVFGAGPGGFFAADRWDIGEPLGVGAIYDAIFHVTGVASARIVWMAATPLPEGTLPPSSAPDLFDPGAIGVVRCDNDPAGDPFGRLGTFRLQPPETP